jgi:hypothetical protein
MTEGQPPAGDPPSPPEQPQSPSQGAAPGGAPGAEITPYDPQARYPDGYPAQFDVVYQEEYHRLLPIVKGLLVIPHWIVLIFLWIGSLLAGLVSWFAVLFTGNFPAGVFEYRVGVYRWTNRVLSYSNLLVDQYPPFSLGEEPDYPAHIQIDPPPEHHVANWRPLLHWLLALPHTIILYFVYGIGAPIAVFIAFFAILFTKTYPRGLFDFVVNANRWYTRVWAYRKYMTEKYPPFTLG